MVRYCNSTTMIHYVVFLVAAVLSLSFGTMTKISTAAETTTAAVVECKPADYQTVRNTKRRE